MALRTPDRLHSDIVHEFSGVRDRCVHVGAIVSVVGLEFVGLAIDHEAADVVDLLHCQFDGVVNGVAGRDKRPG